MSLIVIAPVDLVYALTVPSKRLVVSVEFTTTTEFPGIYAKSAATDKLTEPLVGVIVAEVEAVKNLSPGRPVAPVTPVGPAAPVCPVAPIGPSTPSKFTLYTALLAKVP